MTKQPTLASLRQRPRPRRRRWLWFLGGCAAGVALVVGLLLAPPVQGWLVRRVIATQPGWKIAFERFGAGPRGVDVRGLEFAMPGVLAKSEPIAIRIAPGRLLNRRELRIQRADAQKLLVTLTPAEISTTGPAEPFTGVMRLLQMPIPWAIDAARIDGEIAVREGGESLIVVAFQVEGGGVSAGQPGSFRYELAINSALLPIGPDNKVRSQGIVRITQTPTHGVGEITIEGDLVLPKYGEQRSPAGKIALSIRSTSAGEEYRLHVDVGDGAALEFAGELDIGRNRLTGRLTFRMDQSLAEIIASTAIPRATLEGGVDLAFDTRTGDLDATLAGDLVAGDWQRVMPEFSVVDAFKGKLSAAIKRRAGRLTVEQLAVALLAQDSPAALRLELTEPVDPQALPSTPVATVAIERLPATWANPWLAPANVQLEPGELSGAWRVVASSQALRLVPSGAWETSSLRVRGAPLVPPASLAFSPRAEISSSRAVVAIDDLRVSTEAGDRADARVRAGYDFSTGAMSSSGDLTASLPTLLSGADQAIPLSLNTRWDLSQTGTHMRVDALEVSARVASAADSQLALELLKPLTVDTEKIATAPTSDGVDWLRLRFDGFPLGWISRWVPDYTVRGELASGESVLRSATDGQLAFVTPVPWQITNGELGASGRTWIAGTASATPGMAMHGDRYSGTISEIVAADESGNRVTGSVTFEANLKDEKASAAIALDAALPSLPQSAGAFGPLQASLRVTMHNESARIAMVDAFALRVRNPERELIALEAPAPFLFGRSKSNTLITATVAPMRLTYGEMPLPWFRPWFGEVDLAGTLEPGEFALTAETTKFLLRPIKPVRIRGLAVRKSGSEMARDADVAVFPGLDATVICVLKPKFQLAYTGTLHATNAAVDLGGQRAIDLDAAMGFIGDDTKVLPAGLELTARVDFAEAGRLPALAGRAVPAAGSLVARVNGDLLGQQPTEFWSRIEGVPTAKGDGILPPMEITAHGKVRDAARFVGGVEVQLATQPRATDARFDVTVDPRDAKLDIASGFRSQFFDVAAMLAVAEAFQPKAPESPAAARSAGNAPVRRASYSQLGAPFWSVFRGHFDLDVGTVQYAPYRIDGVRGRLDFYEREFILRDLKGEMFAGRWSGNLRIDYEPGDPAADHFLTGGFRIEQFDSARVVQTVFPTELASVDARINVRSEVQSRGNALFELIDRAEGRFTVEGREGLVRLTVPKQELAATAAVFGGTVLLSPELRALGRLLKKFAEMPVDKLRISGERSASGEVRLTELRFDSPQARILARGRVAPVDGEPLMNRPLELSIDLAAKDEMAVILGGMKLIEKKPRADGYRPLKEKFVLGGKAGEPDTRPLYDLLAKAVIGSKGTWGFLMRKVQQEVNKSKPEPAKSAALVP